MNNRAYMFLDESGNFDFGLNGSRYFVLTSVSLWRPSHLIRSLDAYRHECLEFGLNLESFHCAKDNRYVRKRVFDLISAHLDEIRIDSIVVEKRKATPTLRQGDNLYSRMLGYLLRYVTRRENTEGAVEYIVITDALPFIGERGAAETVVRRTVARMLPGGTGLRIFHHASCSHYGLQLADYCSWAIYRKWERGDSGYLDRIQPAVRSEFDIFGAGQRGRSE